MLEIIRRRRPDCSNAASPPVVTMIRSLYGLSADGSAARVRDAKAVPWDPSA